MEIDIKKDSLNIRIDIKKDSFMIKCSEYSFKIIYIDTIGNESNIKYHNVFNPSPKKD